MTHQGGPPDLKTPIADALIRELLSPFDAHDKVSLAVSGGSDSMALMHLAARWCVLLGRDIGNFNVITVDHGLRPDSAADAQAVCAAASALGFRADVLRWEGDKPESGLMEAAREMRYRLMGDCARRAGAGALALAHTQDDQAETVLLRLARGSGVDGLSAMRAEMEIAGLTILRPLLTMSRARLRGYLRSIGVGWTDDPSNDSAAFERVRIRRSLRLLRETGITAAALARSAERLRRARDALDMLALEALSRTVTFHQAGFAAVDRAEFAGLPHELRLRGLAFVLRAVAGGERPPRLMRVERLEVSLAEMPRGRITLGGAILDVRQDKLRVYREPGRQKLTARPLAPGEEMLWDGRFTIRAGRDLPAGLSLAPLGDAGWRAISRADMPVAGHNVPYIARITAPAIWHGADCIAAPVLGWCAPGFESALRALSVEFRPALRPQPGP